MGYEPTDKDMNSYIEAYLEHIVGYRGLSDATVKTYLQDLQTFVKFLDMMEAGDLRNVDRRTVRGFLVFLVDKNYQRSSISRKLSVVRGFYRWLVTEGVLSVDPVPRRSTMKKEVKLPRFLTNDEVVRLIDSPKSGIYSETLRNRDVALLELLYASGLRVSEAHGLNIGDVDFHSKTVKVIGKGDKERLTLFGLAAKSSLHRYIIVDRPKIKDFDKSDSLFLSKQGSRLSIRSIQNLVKKYARLAGLGNEVHTHTLRHSFATHLINGGADLRIVQDLLGHSSPSTTQIYTHVTGVEARKSYLDAHPMAKELEEKI
jgi:site-specific recombinase XerD